MSPPIAVAWALVGLVLASVCLTMIVIWCGSEIPAWREKRKAARRFPRARVAPKRRGR